jgi:hypothetical protein
MASKTRGQKVGVMGAFCGTRFNRFYFEMKDAETDSTLIAYLYPKEARDLTTALVEHFQKKSRTRRRAG